MQPMHALITGGAGFIGSHLAEALLEKGHHVTVIDNLSTGRYKNIANLKDNPRFRFLIYFPPETECWLQRIRTCLNLQNNTEIGGSLNALEHALHERPSTNNFLLIVGVIMKTALSKLDEILVRIGRYPGKKELIEDAFRTLLRAKPELKRDVAIELYKKNEVSMSRASEICGLSIEDFKELLKEKAVKISVPRISGEEIDKEVERILEAI